MAKKNNQKAKKNEKAPVKNSSAKKIKMEKNVFKITNQNTIKKAKAVTKQIQNVS